MGRSVEYNIYMFLGEYNHIIDEKRRISIPAKLRKDLGKRIVIKKGTDKCLEIYPEKVWGKIKETINPNFLDNKNLRNLSRFVYSAAQLVDVDSAGRILVNETFEEYAGLKEQVVIAGVQNRLEIWDKSEWEKIRNAVDANSETLVETFNEELLNKNNVA